MDGGGHNKPLNVPGALWYKLCSSLWHKMRLLRYCHKASKCRDSRVLQKIPEFYNRFPSFTRFPT